MLLKLLKSNSPYIFIILPLAAAAIWWRSFFGNDISVLPLAANPTIAYAHLQNIIPPATLGSRIIAFLLLIFQGFFLLKFNSSFIFLKQRTAFPSIFFIIAVSCIIPLQRMHPMLIGNFFLLFALHRLFLSYKRERLSYEIFESSLLIALGSLFYINLLFFLPIVWAGLLILRPGRWREWAFSILGFLTPWIALIAIDFSVNLSISKTVENLSQAFVTTGASPQWRLPVVIFISLKFFLSLIAIFHITGTLKSKKVLPRKMFSVLLWLFIITVAVYLLSGTAGMEMLITAAVPVSFLLSEYFLSIRSAGWGNFLLFLLIMAYTGLLIF